MEGSETLLQLCGMGPARCSFAVAEEDTVLEVWKDCETEEEDGRLEYGSAIIGTAAAFRACPRLSNDPCRVSRGLGLPRTGSDSSFPPLLKRAQPPGMFPEEEPCETALMYILSASSWLNSCDSARSSWPIGVEVSSSSLLSSIWSVLTTFCDWIPIIGDRSDGCECYTRPSENLGCWRLGSMVDCNIEGGILSSVGS